MGLNKNYVDNNNLIMFCHSYRVRQKTHNWITYITMSLSVLNNSNNINNSRKHMETLTGTGYLITLIFI